MSDLDLFQEEEPLKTVYDRALVGWLLDYARPHAAALSGCVILLLVLSALQTAEPYVIKLAIDNVMRPASLATGPERETLLRGLWPLVAVYLLLEAGSAVLQYAQSLWLRRTGQHILTAIRSDTFAHMQTLSLSFFDSRPTGRIVTRVTNDIEALGEMYTSVLVNLFRDLFFVFGSAAVIIWLDVRLALVSLVALPAIAVTSVVFRHFARDAYRAMRARLAGINATMSESLSGMRVIQVFNRQERSADEFRAINEDYYTASLKLIRVFGTFSPVLSLLTSLALAGVLWNGGLRVLSGTLTFGTLYAFTSYLRRMYDPISALAEKYNILQSALAAAERITQLRYTVPEVRDPETPRRGPPSPDTSVPAVEFENVWFAYKPGDWVLSDVSFRVDHGETVAFVGHTGAGKSTIMNLLPRFYDVQRGAVRVEGIDVKLLAQEELRRSVGIVMQDVFLFASDIAANISLGNDAISRASVERAGKVVGADAFVALLPEGYDTQVVERGMNLSTGQRQMVSFARALAYDPRILILDEATSSVDSETEEAVQHAMRALASGRTTIVVAHRLATVRDADRIYVLHRGRIVEQGRHEELLRLGGMYRTLWRLQYDAGQTG